MTDQELSELRAKFLALEGLDLIGIHGWLLGVACAVERKRGEGPTDADRLIAELRASTGAKMETCQGCNGQRVRVYPGTPLGHVETCRMCAGRGELAVPICDGTGHDTEGSTGLSEKGG